MYVKKYYIAMIETIRHISLNRILIFLKKPSLLYLYLQFHTSADGLLYSAVFCTVLEENKQKVQLELMFANALYKIENISLFQS